MEKSKYMQHLREEIAVLMERPVSLGRAEEICAYADTICAIRKLDGAEPVENHDGFTRENAERWVQHMQNADGSTGPNWTLEQATAVANSIGVHTDPWVWFAAMNMMYSDYWESATRYGVDRPEYYADLAKEFLFDKDMKEIVAAYDMDSEEYKAVAYLYKMMRGETSIADEVDLGE